MKKTILINKLLKISGMSKLKPVGNPVDTLILMSTIYQKQLTLDENTVFKSIVGWLIYLGTHTKPDLSGRTSMLGSNVDSPREAHILMVRRALRYLRGTIERTPVLKPESYTKLCAYVDPKFFELTQKVQCVSPTYLFSYSRKQYIQLYWTMERFTFVQILSLFLYCMLRATIWNA